MNIIRTAFAAAVITLAGDAVRADDSFEQAFCRSMKLPQAPDVMFTPGVGIVTGISDMQPFSHNSQSPWRVLCRGKLITKDGGRYDGFVGMFEAPSQKMAVAVATSPAEWHRRADIFLSYRSKTIPTAKEIDALQQDTDAAQKDVLNGICDSKDARLAVMQSPLAHGAEAVAGYMSEKAIGIGTSFPSSTFCHGALFFRNNTHVSVYLRGFSMSGQWFVEPDPLGIFLAP